MSKPEELAKAEVRHRPPDLSNDTVFLAWQRNHLANERTFLSFLGSSISLLGLGFVLTKLELYLRQSAGAGGQLVTREGLGGAMFLGLLCYFGSALTIVFGAIRYAKMRRNIDGGVQQFSVVPQVFGVILGLIVVVLAILLSLSGIS